MLVIYVVRGDTTTGVEVDPEGTVADVVRAAGLDPQGWTVEFGGERLGRDTLLADSGLSNQATVTLTHTSARLGWAWDSGEAGEVKVGSEGMAQMMTVAEGNLKAHSKVQTGNAYIDVLPAVPLSGTLDYVQSISISPQGSWSYYVAARPWGESETVAISLPAGPSTEGTVGWVVKMHVKEMKLHATCLDIQGRQKTSCVVIPAEWEGKDIALGSYVYEQRSTIEVLEANDPRVKTLEDALPYPVSMK
eukprot:Hpha_TRINITY_DN27961_c0_g1::TRINITY_DN27961_c0_g1_i1::g.44927::m.44927